LTAAEKIIGTNENTLEFLVSKSLLRLAPFSHYDMYILIRRYAEEKLDSTGGSSQLRDAHLSFYRRLAENSQPGVAAVDDVPSNTHLEQELDNIRAALTWAIESGAQESGLRLATAVGSFWYTKGYLREGIYWLSRMLALKFGQFPSAWVFALNQSGSITRSLGNFEQALSLNKESLSLFKEMKDKRGIGLALMNLGIVSYLNGDFKRATRILKISLVRFQETMDEWHQGEARIRLGEVYLRQGRLDEAALLFKESLLQSIKIDHKLATAFSLGGLGDIHRLQGKYDQAVDLYKESLDIHWEYQHNLDIPYTLEALALAYAGLGENRDASFLWGAADNLRERHSSPMPPVYQENHTLVMLKVRAELGDPDFTRGWAEGSLTPLEKIVAWVNPASYKLL